MRPFKLFWAAFLFPLSVAAQQNPQRLAILPLLKPLTISNVAAVLMPSICIDHERDPPEIDDRYGFVVFNGSVPVTIKRKNKLPTASTLQQLTQNELVYFSPAGNGINFVQPAINYRNPKASDIDSIIILPFDVAPIISESKDDFLGPQRKALVTSFSQMPGQRSFWMYSRLLEILQANHLFSPDSQGKLTSGTQALLQKLYYDNLTDRLLVHIDEKNAEKLVSDGLIQLDREGAYTPRAREIIIKNSLIPPSWEITRTMTATSLKISIHDGGGGGSGGNYSADDDFESFEEFSYKEFDRFGIKCSDPSICIELSNGEPVKLKLEGECEFESGETKNSFSGSIEFSSDAKMEIAGSINEIDFDNSSDSLEHYNLSVRFADGQEAGDTVEIEGAEICYPLTESCIKVKFAKKEKCIGIASFSVDL